MVKKYLGQILGQKIVGQILDFFWILINSTLDLGQGLVVLNLKRPKFHFEGDFLKVCPKSDVQNMNPKVLYSPLLKV